MCQDEILVVLIYIQALPHLQQVLLQREERQLRVAPLLPLPMPAFHHLLSIYFPQTPIHTLIVSSLLPLIIFYCLDWRRK
jgi:hypothetical protein